MKTTFLLCMVAALAFGLSACGQRVHPKQPEGKIIPSNQY